MCASITLIRVLLGDADPTLFHQVSEADDPDSGGDTGSASVTARCAGGFRLPATVDRPGVFQFGTQVSLLAVPLVAIMLLQANPFQVALLGTVEFLPFILFSLPAGAWVDRLRRRPNVIVARSSAVP